MKGEKTMKQFWKDLSKAFDDNAPTILSILAIGGVITTGILAANSALEAKKVLEEAKNQPETKTEAIAKTWQCYVPPVVSGAITIAAIVASDRMNKSRIMALASAYALSNKNAKEYRDKVKEMLGEKTDQKIKDEIGKKKASEISGVTAPEGKMICIDSMTGQQFISSIDDIQRAAANVNRALVRDSWCSFSDFLYDIGARQSKMADGLGWHVEQGGIEVNFTSCLTADNVPALVINYSEEPNDAPWK